MSSTQSLAAELEPVHRRHRQMALFRHGLMTLALRLFNSGARLPNLVVDSPIITQVFNGELNVGTALRVMTCRRGSYFVSRRASSTTSTQRSPVGCS